MTQKYLLIESRDPFDSKEVDNDYALAIDLAAQGGDTTLFLVQNGVLAARSGARTSAMNALLNGGVHVVCDEFSLRERGIYGEHIADGVTTGPLDIVVEQLASGTKAIWL